jgi:hypothetical protein
MARKDRERAFIEADLATVKALLAELPPNSLLERMGLEARSAELQRALTESAPRLLEHIRSVDLFFGGEPVIGTSGIDARFATKALAAFQRAISASAKIEGTILGARGPLPDDLATLHITDVVHGSFGFRLEELGQQELTDTTSRLGQGIERVEEVLAALTDQDPEVFVDAVADTDSRVIVALKEFMSTLKDYRAVCRVVSEEREVSFPTVDIAREAARRITTYNIETTEDVLEGTLWGVLPDSRRFEFRTASGEITRGSISRAIERPEELQALVQERVFANIRTTTVARPGRTSRRSTLKSLSTGKPTQLF